MPNSHEKHLKRVRHICVALPESTEKLSHDAPTFFVGKKVFAMFTNNHNHDGRIAIWIPVAAGLQPILIETSPQKFFHPPYVGVRGWVGIELSQIKDEELTSFLLQAWKLIAPKKLQFLA